MNQEIEVYLLGICFWMFLGYDNIMYIITQLIGNIPWESHHEATKISDTSEGLILWPICLW